MGSESEIQRFLLLAAMGVADSLEAYLHSVESYVAQTVTNVQEGGIQDAAQRIWNDITRYGPPSIEQLPGLGSFSIPPPPPPPAPPAPTLGEIIAENKLLAAGAGLGAAFTTIGITGTTGFLAGTGGAAVITTGGVLTGSSIAVRGMARRTKQVGTFDLLPLHNNKRLNCIITVPG